LADTETFSHVREFRRMITEDTLIFVDGENLALRYKEMLAAGRIPRPDNIYVEDCFVWNQRILDSHLWRIKRIAYYTSAAGDSDYVRAVCKAISETTYTCVTNMTNDGVHRRTGQIIPFVRKKGAKSRKESICDIAIAVDVMRACYRDHASTVWLFSGDGDFIKLIEEVIHSGKRSFLSASSSGFHSDLKFAVDDFLPLDDHFFLTKPEIEAAGGDPVATKPTDSA
jgi:uncharacterized LabA/DUF88 family protein